MWVPDAANKERFAVAVAAVKSAEAKLTALREQRRGAFAAWLGQAPGAPIAVGDELASFAFEERMPSSPSPPPSVSKEVGETGEKEPAYNLTARLTGAARFASAVSAEEFAVTPKENESVSDRGGLAVKTFNERLCLDERLPRA